MRHTVLVLFLNVLCIWYARTYNIDQQISKANIYYQRALQNGAPRELLMSEVEELDSKQDIKIIIHGYISSRTHSSIRPLVHAYMANGVDNVFLADWEDAAGVDYPGSRKAVASVAVHFGRIINDFIEKLQIERSEFHIIGHSLGAHIAGGVGKFFNGSLGRVTGLDPALPLFTPKAKDGLYATAAQFVDAIHTDFPVFGDITPRGTVDFYPHFGLTPQRGCSDFDLNTVNKLILQSYSCSHNRAVELYAESIGLPHNFPALPCSLKGIKLRSVDNCLQKIQRLHISPAALATAIAEIDADTVVYMGEKVSKNATGLFYLETYDAPPYGMGMYTRF